MILGGVLLLWFALLVVLGFAYGGSRGERIAERLGEAVKGEGGVEGSDLALVRGRLSVEQLRVRRDDEVGKLALDISELRCELPPVGIALFDSECRELVLDGLALDVSTFDVFRVQRPKRPPMRAREVTIENATIGVPLETGRVDIKLAYIIAGPTVFKTPVSWLFELRGLRATVTMPLGTVELAYLNGVLVAWGGIFTTPLVLAVPPPALDPADDNRAELARIVGWGKALAKRVLKENLKSLMRQPL
jgi:hypothetical protein